MATQPQKTKTPPRPQRPDFKGQPLVMFNPNAVYGDVPFQLPVYSMAEVEDQVLHEVLPDNSNKWPLWQDDTGMSLGGLDAAKPLEPKIKQEEPPPHVDVTLPQAVKPSTIYAVAGVAAVAILGSIALWAWFRSKGKGK